MPEHSQHEAGTHGAGQGVAGPTAVGAEGDPDTSVCCAVVVDVRPVPFGVVMQGPVTHPAPPCVACTRVRQGGFHWLSSFTVSISGPIDTLGIASSST